MNRHHISWNIVYLWYYCTFNSLALGGCGNNLISLISEPRTRLMACQNIVSGNSMVPAGNKPLPVPMLAQLSVGRIQQATRGLDMIYHIICDVHIIFDVHTHTHTHTPHNKTDRHMYDIWDLEYIFRISCFSGVEKVTLFSCLGMECKWEG